MKQKLIPPTCGAVGFSVTIAYVIYSLLTYDAPATGTSALIAVLGVVTCPPYILSLYLFDVDISKTGIVLLYLVFALMNAALYFWIAKRVQARIQRQSTAI